LSMRQQNTSKPQADSNDSDVDILAMGQKME
jgi:hypothetical protein